MSERPAEPFSTQSARRSPGRSAAGTRRAAGRSVLTLHSSCPPRAASLAAASLPLAAPRLRRPMGGRRCRPLEACRGGRSSLTGEGRSCRRPRCAGSQGAPRRRAFRALTPVRGREPWWSGLMLLSRFWVVPCLGAAPSVAFSWLCLSFRPPS